MKTAAICAALNTAVAYEHAASLQYKQHGLMVQGLWRRMLTEFFAAESRKALAHAQHFGQKIVALGGVPTVEVGATVQQSLEVTEMLEHDLALERLALEGLPGGLAPDGGRGRRGGGLADDARSAYRGGAAGRRRAGAVPGDGADRGLTPACHG